MNKAIYPDVKHWQKHGILHFETYLRKTHRKKAYLQCIYQSYQIIGDLNPSGFIDIANQFHSEVYKAIILGKVAIGVTNIYGQKCFNKDTDQQSETERLISHINTY